MMKPTSNNQNAFDLQKRFRTFAPEKLNQETILNDARGNQTYQ